MIPGKGLVFLRRHKSSYSPKVLDAVYNGLVQLYRVGPRTNIWALVAEGKMIIDGKGNMRVVPKAKEKVG